MPKIKAFLCIEILAVTTLTLLVIFTPPACRTILSVSTHLAHHILTNFLRPISAQALAPFSYSELHHALRITTAATSGAILAVCCAAWQTLRRAPSACIRSAGVLMSTFLGSIVGQALRYAASLDPQSPSSSRILPIFISIVFALVAMAWPTPRTQRKSLGSIPIYIWAAIFLLALCLPLVLFIRQDAISGARQAVIWATSSLDFGHQASWMAALSCTVVGTALLVHVAGALTHLLAGEAWAQLVGVQVTRTRALACLGISLLLAAGLELSGHMLGVGLFAAAIARLSVGDMPRLLWPTSGVVGAIAAIWVDALAAASGDVQELPVGLFCGCLGAATLLYNRARAAQEVI